MKKKQHRSSGHYKRQALRRVAAKARYEDKKVREAAASSAGPLVALRLQPVPANRSEPPWLNPEAGGCGERGDVLPTSFGFGDDDSALPGSPFVSSDSSEAGQDGRVAYGGGGGPRRRLE